jgi:hypothetical protein
MPRDGICHHETHVRPNHLLVRRLVNDTLLVWHETIIERTAWHEGAIGSFIYVRRAGLEEESRGIQLFDLASTRVRRTLEQYQSGVLAGFLYSSTTL